MSVLAAAAHPELVCGVLACSPTIAIDQFMVDAMSGAVTQMNQREITYYENQKQNLLDLINVGSEAASAAQLGGWLAEWGVPEGPVNCRPIRDVAPRVSVDGPAPELVAWSLRSGEELWRSPLPPELGGWLSVWDGALYGERGTGDEVVRVVG